MFWLEEPQDNNTLKRWAKSQKDLVDPSIYDSVQPHYVTDPTFEDPSMNPFKDRSRLTYFRKNRRTVPGGFLDNFKTPTLFKIDSKTPGVLNPDGARPAGPTSSTGKLIDNREDFLLKLRWRLMRNGYEDFDQFVADVFEKFCAGAELGVTETSETDWDFELVRRKCEQDRNRLPMHVGPRIQLTYDYLPREKAQEQLEALITGFLAAPQNLLIRAEAGLGKSSAAQRALAQLPDLGGKNVEIYVPTKKLAREWAEGLKRENEELDVRVVEGRSEDTCHKSELVKKVAKLGGGVSHHLCHDEKTDQSCEYWGSCPWSTQNPNDAPAIRIVTHSQLKLDRPESFPEPDFIIVDEGILSEQVVAEEIHLKRLTSMLGYKPNLGQKNFYGPALDGSGDTLLDHYDLEHVLRVGKLISACLNEGASLLAYLRSKQVCPLLLERCRKTISAFSPFPWISPADSADSQFSSLNKAKSEQLAEIRLLSRMFGLLAIEMETGRNDSRTITTKDGRVQIRYRQNMKRLEGISTLFLDADGEIEVLRKSVPDLTETKISVRYNAEISQVSDRSFSKYSLGMGSEAFENALRDEVERFLAKLPAGQSTLIVTYMALQEALTGTGEGFSRMSDGVIVGHFGNIRGTDDYKNFDSIVVIGRNRPPEDVIGLTAAALDFDNTDEISNDLKAAVYRSKVTSETNQAVARLRLVWTDTPKTVYLLSNEDVPFTVDYSVTWQQLLEDKYRMPQLFQRHNVVPLSAGWLTKNASTLFDTKKAAERWIEEYVPKGSEDGIFRVKGSKGPHKRFLMHPNALDPIDTLTRLCGPLSAYYGPSPGIVMDGRLWRHAYNEPEFKSWYATLTLWQHPLPEPS